MKESFKRDMRFIYPEGVDNATQYRDLIRTYSMGWVSAFMAANDKPRVEEQVPFLREMTDPAWRPDASWKWW